MSNFSSNVEVREFSSFEEFMKALLNTEENKTNKTETAPEKGEEPASGKSSKVVYIFKDSSCKDFLNNEIRVWNGDNEGNIPELTVNTILPVELGRVLNPLLRSALFHKTTYDLVEHSHHFLNKEEEEKVLGKKGDTYDLQFYATKSGVDIQGRVLAKVSEADYNALMEWLGDVGIK